MDTLTTIVFVAILLVLAAPVIEIAVKRPGIFFELNAGTRAFAEAALRKEVLMEAAAEDHKIPAKGFRTEMTHSGCERLAA